MRPRGSPYPSVHANMRIINVCSPPRVGIRRHSSAGARGGVVRFLYDDPGQTGPLDSRVGTLCLSPAQFEAASPFRAIPGEAELECVLTQTPSVGSGEYGADLPRPGLRMQAWSQCPSLRFFHTLPPPNTGVWSVPVSAWRFIVVTRLTEGFVFVGSCEADGGSA